MYSEPDTMKEKVSESLWQSFQFDPAVEREAVPDEKGVVMMKPLVGRENALPPKLVLAVSEERIKRTEHVSFKDGGELIKNTIGEFTVETKPPGDLIPTRYGAENPVVRWTLLRKSW